MRLKRIVELVLAAPSLVGRRRRVADILVVLLAAMCFKCAVEFV